MFTVRFACPTILLSILCAAICGPCFGRNVQTATGTNIDMSRYKTYQWLPPKVLTKTGVVENDPVVAPAIKAAVNRELAAKGLKEVAEGGDLLVSALALRSASPQLEAVLFPVTAVNLDFSTPIATMGRYNHEGTLAVNLIDAKTQKFAWFGMATESIDNKPGAGVKKLPKAAAAIFKKYPGAK